MAQDTHERPNKKLAAFPFPFLPRHRAAAGLYEPGDQEAYRLGALASLE
jgi:hypothetical protein